MSKSIYEVLSYDVCVSGFERLRSYSEFMLVTSVDAASSPESLLDGLLSDIQACARPDDFDYDAANALVRDFVASELRPLFAKSNPFKLEDRKEDDDSEGCSLFVYIQDNRDGAHYPVY